jgi:IS30 family transposase
VLQSRFSASFSCQLNSLPLSKVKVLTQCLSGVSSLLIASFAFRGRIPNRIDIDERPSIVDARTRIDDWEVDLVIGKGHKGGFNV